jgi:hypothetical protein
VTHPDDIRTVNDRVLAAIRAKETPALADVEAIALWNAKHVDHLRAMRDRGLRASDGGS